MMPTAAAAKTVPEPRTVLISNRITWVDTPVVTSPFPALDEIDQLIPVQGAKAHNSSNSRR